VNESAAQWWYERGGQQAGPVPLETLQQLAASGELTRATRVWTPGMPGWSRAETVPALAWPPAAPPMPPPLPAGEDAVPTPGGAATERATDAGATDASAPAAPATDPARDARAEEPRRTEPVLPTAPVRWNPAAPASPAQAVAEPEALGVATILLLSLVTLGVYGMVKFFQTARAYERLAGRETRFALYFWLFVGLLSAGALLHVGFGVPLGIAALVFQFLALGEALRARREAVARWDLRVQTTSDSRHYLLLGLGVALSFVLVGFVFLALQAARWFQDWNAIRAAALARGELTARAARSS
jgi:GYF domain 2